MKLRNIAFSLSALVLLSLPTINAKEANSENLTGWQTINGQQYYYNEDGTKATSSWIDRSFVDKRRKKSCWIVLFMMKITSLISI